MVSAQETLGQKPAGRQKALQKKNLLQKPCSEGDGTELLLLLRNPVKIYSWKQQNLNKILGRFLQTTKHRESYSSHPVIGLSRGNWMALVNAVDCPPKGGLDCCTVQGFPGFHPSNLQAASPVLPRGSKHRRGHAYCISSMQYPRALLAYRFFP